MLTLEGIEFRMHTVIYLLGKHRTTKIEADFLCTSGPFAYIRNPLSLGNFIIGLALSISFKKRHGCLD